MCVCVRVCVPMQTVLSAAMDPSPDNRPSLEQIEKALLDTHEYVIATQ